ncbi:hypothetical protein CYLTODRAFT_140876 [Cylindrobasidium torrendii FP15055 ss-10]|uniref:Uncharacterized protein n=1 Tax=Cylindrobasidium torrendii FP15055 ss-10 TaxID=1314674 RepID=A0A0D7B1I4_9AGAR|nr:hypothetical protein CYLTODRAFT_140876 [Cylindrobasidium torrendii FP15055 ss-10]
MRSVLYELDSKHGLVGLLKRWRATSILYDVADCLHILAHFNIKDGAPRKSSPQTPTSNLHHTSTCIMYLILEALRDDAEMFGFVDGRLEVPAYQWAKPKSKKARMCKIQGVAQPTEMAIIEVHDFSDDVCIINGVDRRPRSGASGIFRRVLRAAHSA